MGVDMLIRQLFTGAFAGATATAPMTVAMELMHRWLPQREQYPLPPREITANVTKKAGVQHKLDEEERTALTIVNHFAYGAGVGAVYGPIASKLPGSGVVKGMGWGLIVWLVSYFGVLPALDILPPASEHPARRNALMIVAHVIWGAVAGVIVEQLQQQD